MICEDMDRDDYDDGPDTIGCYQCESGWRHGCMDDMCRACTPADECEDGYACKFCNRGGEVMW